MGTRLGSTSQAWRLGVPVSPLQVKPALALFVFVSAILLLPSTSSAQEDAASLCLPREFRRQSSACQNGQHAYPSAAISAVKPSMLAFLLLVIAYSARRLEGPIFLLHCYFRPSFPPARGVSCLVSGYSRLSPCEQPGPACLFLCYPALILKKPCTLCLCLFLQEAGPFSTFLTRQCWTTAPTPLSPSLPGKSHAVSRQLFS